MGNRSFVVRRSSPDLVLRWGRLSIRELFFNQSSKKYFTDLQALFFFLTVRAGDSIQAIRMKNPHLIKSFTAALVASVISSTAAHAVTDTTIATSQYDGAIISKASISGGTYKTYTLTSLNATNSEIVSETVSATASRLSISAQVHVQGVTATTASSVVSGSSVRKINNKSILMLILNTEVAAEIKGFELVSVSVAGQNGQDATNYVSRLSALDNAYVGALNKSTGEITIRPDVGSTSSPYVDGGTYLSNFIKRSQSSKTGEVTQSGFASFYLNFFIPADMNDGISYLGAFGAFGKFTEKLSFATEASDPSTGFVVSGRKSVSFSGQGAGNGEN